MDGNGLGCLELKTSDDVDAAMKLDQSEFKNSLMEDGVTITVARPDDFKSPEPAADGGGGGGGGGGDNDVDEDGRDRRRSRSRSRDGDDEEDSSKKAEDADGDASCICTTLAVLLDLLRTGVGGALLVEGVAVDSALLALA